MVTSVSFLTDPDVPGVWSMCCYHVGNNIGSWAIGEVMVVIERVVDEKDDREVDKVRKVVTKEWTKANSSDTGFFDFRLQVWFM